MERFGRAEPSEPRPFEGAVAGLCRHCSSGKPAASDGIGGRLYLSVNDNFFDDNTGKLNPTVEID